MSTPKQDYIERLTKWLMPDRGDPELAAEARIALGLDGVYTGKSQRIWRMLRLAYLRGVRRGAAIAWSAQQPITLRSDEVAPTAPGGLAPGPVSDVPTGEGWWLLAVGGSEGGVLEYVEHVWAKPDGSLWCRPVQDRPAQRVADVHGCWIGRMVLEPKPKTTASRPPALNSTGPQCNATTPAGNRCSRGADMCDRHGTPTKRPAPNPTRPETWKI